MGQLTWNGDEILKRIDEAVIAGIAEAFLDVYVILLSQRLLQDYSPPPSSPGEPPHAGRGRSDPKSLVNSIMVWAIPDQDKVIVGSMVEHALSLELGTDIMQPRPVWQDTLIQVLDKLASEIGQNSVYFLGTFAPHLNSNNNLNPLSIMTSEVPSEIPHGRMSFLPSF